MATSNGFRQPLGDGTDTEADDNDAYKVDQDFNNPNTTVAPGKTVYHLGEDWNAEDGTDFGDPVYAISNGKVLQSGDLGPNGLGQYIVIRHDLPTPITMNGITTDHVVSLYAHLSERDVQVGDDVVIGEEIGNVGATGKVTGPHLHFEIRLGESYRDASGYEDFANKTGWVDPTEFINQHRSFGTTDDYAGNTATDGVITPGGSQVLGNIEEPRDSDWFRVQVTQGSTYTINLANGSPPQVSPFLNDPQVYLYDSGGQLVSSNDDFGGGLNSQLTFTATYTGNYFIGAGEFGDNDTGTYRLSVSAASPSATNPTASGNPITTAANPNTGTSSSFDPFVPSNTSTFGFSDPFASFNSSPFGFSDPFASFNSSPSNFSSDSFQFNTSSSSFADPFASFNTSPFSSSDPFQFNTSSSSFSDPFSSFNSSPFGFSDPFQFNTSSSSFADPFSSFNSSPFGFSDPFASFNSPSFGFSDPFQFSSVSNSNPFGQSFNTSPFGFSDPFQFNSFGGSPFGQSFGNSPFGGFDPFFGLFGGQ